MLHFQNVRVAPRGELPFPVITEFQILSHYTFLHFKKLLLKFRPVIIDKKMFFLTDATNPDNVYKLAEVHNEHALI